MLRCIPNFENELSMNIFRHDPYCIVQEGGIRSIAPIACGNDRRGGHYSISCSQCAPGLLGSKAVAEDHLPSKYSKQICY